MVGQHDLARNDRFAGNLKIAIRRLPRSRCVQRNPRTGRAEIAIGVNQMIVDEPPRLLLLAIDGDADAVPIVPAFLRLVSISFNSTTHRPDCRRLPAVQRVAHDSAVTGIRLAPKRRPAITREFKLPRQRRRQIFERRDRARI